MTSGDHGSDPDALFGAGGGRDEGDDGLGEIADRLDSLAWARMPDDVRSRLRGACVADDSCRESVIPLRRFGLASAAMLLLGVGIGWVLAWGVGGVGSARHGVDRAAIPSDSGAVVDRGVVDGEADGVLSRVELASMLFSRPRSNAARVMDPSSWGQMVGRD